MPYCTNCGEEVTKEQRYCSYCGEQVGGDDHDHRRGRTTPSASEPTASDHPQSPESQPAQHETPGPTTERPGGSRISTIGTYFGSLRWVVGQPFPLLALFVAWFSISALVLVPPSGQLLVAVLAAGVGLVAAGVLYLTTEARVTGEETTLSSAYAQVFSTALSLVAIWLVYVIALFAGLSLFILPGLYIGGRLLLAFPACVLDDQGAIESLKTSWRFTRRVSLQPLGFLVLTFVTMVGLSIAFVVPQFLTLSAFGVEIPDIETAEGAFDQLEILLESPRYILINSFYQAITLAIPVGTLQIAAARLYLHQREPTAETDEFDS